MKFGINKDTIKQLYYDKYSLFNIDLANRICNQFNFKFWERHLSTDSNNNPLIESALILSYFCLWWETSESRPFWEALSNAERDGNLTPEFIEYVYEQNDKKFKPATNQRAFEIWFQ